ncbi:hypothetical protein B0H14DRAFT_2833191 [Mycena olivaceomarginata]|nr:hypothetical protein B0H14DRAFT_2833191 [Mycena olivaceomarginata]
MHGVEINWKFLAVSYHFRAPRPAPKGNNLSVDALGAEKTATSEELHATTRPGAEKSICTKGGGSEEPATPAQASSISPEAGGETNTEKPLALTVEGAAEIDLLRETLESVKLRCGAENELLRQELESLEADRPLWEAAKKSARRTSELSARQVEERRRAERDDRVRNTRQREAERKERCGKEEEENARREEKSARRAKKLERRGEERCRKRDETTSKWRNSTRSRSLSKTQPLTFHVIPWPINWDGGRGLLFAREGAIGVNVAGYNSLVEKVHRLFHPDKWKSRRLLLRKSLEEAGNVVAQAMTPIWRRSKGYNT